MVVQKLDQESQDEQTWTKAKQFPLVGFILAQFLDESQLERVAKVEGLFSSYLAHYWLLLGGLFVILVEEHTL